MAETFWKIDERPMTDWGDYGHILQHGMTSHRRRTEGKLSLERTGPFTPPITLPGLGDIVLTYEARAALESSGLTGFTFLPVEKVQIVELHWDQWDLSAEEPPEYPESGEPEDYILERQHSPDTANSLGDLFEVVVPNSLKIVRTPANKLLIDADSWNGDDLIRSVEYGSIIFSERAHRWFTELWGKYVRFEPFPCL